MTTERTKRRWQISVRSSIYCMTMLAVLFAMIGYHLRRLSAQEIAFSEISRRGGTIYVYDEGVYVHFRAPGGICGTGLNRVIGASGSSSEFSDEDVRHLHSVIKLVSVDLRNTSVSVEAVNQLAMKLSPCQVTK